MSIRSRVGRVFDLEPGDRVSYGGTYLATNDERAALIPIGYGDGYRRANSNRSSVNIGGHRCPIVGRICMDQTIVRVPDGVQVREGDEVVVAGGDGAMSLDDLAETAGTIAYEIATGITERVPRVYLDGPEVVAVKDLHGLREFA
jgi:alanine racemase